MERKKNSTLSNGNPISFNIRLAILIILHIVGLVGFFIPEVRPYILQATPFHLIIITLVLFWDTSCLKSSFWVFFVCSFFIGSICEIFGVKSGLIFGYYEYGDVLGYKVLDVPIVIGLLWAGVSYACNGISLKLLGQSKWFATIVAALLMVFFDFMMEPFASHTRLWVWHEALIPAYNYICWFIIGLILSLIYNYTVKKADNAIAPYFIIIQILFFLIYTLLAGNFNLSPFDV